MDGNDKFNEKKKEKSLRRSMFLFIPVYMYYYVTGLYFQAFGFRFSDYKV